jgi:2-polyprenyl-3-methyl-5-hydroxy-6-metoxy-1,4-benzoquinol methylase
MSKELDHLSNPSQVNGRLYANWDSYWKGFMTIPAIEWVRFRLISQTCDRLLKPFAPSMQPKFCELGAGTGVVSRYLGDKYGADITIVDSNPQALQLCQETFKNFPQKFIPVQSDVFELEKYAGQFDLVHSGGLIEHFVDEARGRIIQVHCDLVKEGGHILILVPVLNIWYRILNLGIFKWLHLLDEIHEVPWSWEELSKALDQRGFQIVTKATVVTELGVLARKKKR